MALPILESTTFIAVVGLLIKEIFRTVRYRNHNKNMNKLKEKELEQKDQELEEKKEIKENLKELTKLQHKQSKDTVYIKTKITSFDQRCLQHLKNQEKINDSVEKKVNQLDGRIYDLSQKKKS